MNEAQQMHDELVNALLPIIPRTIYQDLRRLNRLSWAITGLCLTHTVRLGAWAQVLESRAKSAASRERRFSRWLHHPAIRPQQWYAPILRRALSDWSRNARVYVALDTTALTPFVLIRASLVYRGRAIPLAWRAMQHRSTKGGFEDYEPVLEQVRAIKPSGAGITLLADRGGCRMSNCFTTCGSSSGTDLLRLMGNTLIHLPTQPVSAVRDLCPPAGEQRFFHEVALLGAAVGPVHLALACLLDQPDDRLYRGE